MRFLIVAGEESGEIYGARLMREIKTQKPGAEFCGIGGDRMAAEGLKVIRHCREMESIGVVSLLKNFSLFITALNEIRKLVREKRCDAVVLIDYPDFNLRVARAAYESGVPVFYYVCPQFWAWRQYRIRSVRKWVDTMLVALPFEEDFYKERGANARFIGHPMLDEMEIPQDREKLKNDFLTTGQKTLIGLLPGSRAGEVNAILERLVKTADIINREKPDAGFVIPAAPHIETQQIAEVIRGRSYMKVIKGGSHRLMTACDLLITKSGTSTLEGAIAGTPMVIVYNASFFSYWLAKPLVNVKYAGLPNIIAGREIAREFFQYDFTPLRVAKAALEILDSPTAMERARAAMNEVRAKLGEKGAAKRAAEIILNRSARFIHEQNRQGKTKNAGG
ncbi:MAG: lipid-A-disaccharide synthase [bacterium]|nr:MAG: lipid-A-disaccharide synthase [bacterium]